MEETLVPPPAPAYPVRFEADYSESLSRPSTFFRFFLAIPLLIVAAILGGGAGAFGPGFGIGIGLASTLLVVHWITVLVRGRPVRWVFEALVAVQRFTSRADTYFLLMTDRYPPFEGDWPVRYEVDYPERVSRRCLLIWKTLTSIPHFIVLSVLFLFVLVLVFFAWFAILFTGRYPKGFHDFVSGWIRWYVRVGAYWMSLTDQFPPFSLSPTAGPARKRTRVISAVVGVAVLLASVGGVIALVAVPGRTGEVRVSYDALLDRRPSDPAEISDVAVTANFAVDPYEFPDGLYQPEKGERFLVFYLEIENGRDFGFKVREGDFSLKDTNGDAHDPFLVTLAGMQPPKTLEDNSVGDAVVMFQVPEGAGPAELTYSPQFGFKPKIRFEFR